MDDGTCKATQECQAPNGEIGQQCGRFCINPKVVQCEKQWMAGWERCIVTEKKHKMQ